MAVGEAGDDAEGIEHRHRRQIGQPIITTCHSLRDLRSCGLPAGPPSMALIVMAFPSWSSAVNRATSFREAAGKLLLRRREKRVGVNVGRPATGP